MPTLEAYIQCQETSFSPVHTAERYVVWKCQRTVSSYTSSWIPSQLECVPPNLSVASPNCVRNKNSHHVRTGNYKIAHWCWGCYQDEWEKAGGNHEQGSWRELPITQGGEMGPLAAEADIGQDMHFVQAPLCFTEPEVGLMNISLVWHKSELLEFLSICTQKWWNV